jgi:pyrophosphate--fructose-6-phosphate 1-phosphotransferase
MAEYVSLQSQRINDKPKLPEEWHQLTRLSPVAETGATVKPSNDELSTLFPGTYHLPIVHFSRESDHVHIPLKVGVVLSGGPAAGGHNVIAGLYDALKTLNSESSLYGFLDGPKGIIENKSIQITQELLTNYRNTGGFDLIGSGRTKIETEEQFNASEKTVRSLNLDGLVVIGGDDSNTNAALLAEYFLQKQCKTKVVGVPKTIDGDLKNEYIEISFGFDSACKTYSELIGNINRDALSQKKYYFFIKLMGRSASHIALECALQTQPNITLIGEEIEQKQMSLADITKLIADAICLRSEQGKDFGVILIPEGIIEFIPECKQLIHELNLSKELSESSQACFNLMPPEVQKQLLLDRDPHGNVQVSKIESERMFIEMVKTELSERQKKGLYKGLFSPQPLFYGYEGRSCFPSNFDAHYCYALGHVAALLVDKELTGYMAAVNHLGKPVEKWRMSGIPLAHMIHLEKRKGKLKPVIKKALVNLEGASFKLFAAKREKWRVEDQYLFPGPIQFFGPESLSFAITHTLAEEGRASHHRCG